MLKPRIGSKVTRHRYITYNVQIRPMTQSSNRKGWVSALISFFFPGFGQIYNGKSERGAFILVGFVIVFAIVYFFLARTAELGLLFIIGARYLQLLAILFWAWQVYDAYAIARTS